MKKISFFSVITVLLVVLLWNCHSVPKPVMYKIKGKIAGMEQKNATLYTLDKKLNRTPIDTVQVKDSIFEFSVIKQNPHLAIITVENVQIPVVIGDGDIIMDVNKNSVFHSDISQSTSALTKKFYEFERYAKNDREKGFQLMQAYRRSRDEHEQDSLRTAYNQWRKNAEQFQYDFIEANKDYTGLIIMQALLSGREVDFGKIKNAFDQYPPEVKTTNLGKYINTIILTRGATEIGGKAPNFIGTTPDGKKLSLGQAMGKVTIIDFWASWCRPCRIENPYVVEIYNKYHDQGLNIIGVSLDKNKKSWLKAIEDDGLKWQHVSELKHWQDPIAKMYGVNSIPQTFILDAKGIIRAKNLRREELEAKIKELLNE